jgi:hypothetical protein
MGPVFQMMRQGLAALLACLPCSPRRRQRGCAASSDPDAALAAVFKDIERSRLSDALEKVDTLIQRYPNFRLAHLIRGDLLLARSRPLPSFGGSPDAPADKLSDLREEAVARLKAYRNRPPNNYVPRYLLQMEAEQKYAIVVDTQRRGSTSTRTTTAVRASWPTTTSATASSAPKRAAKATSARRSASIT